MDLLSALPPHAHLDILLAKEDFVTSIQIAALTIYAQVLDPAAIIMLTRILKVSRLPVAEAFGARPRVPLIEAVLLIPRHATFPLP